MNTNTVNITVNINVRNITVNINTVNINTVNITVNIIAVNTNTVDINNGEYNGEYEYGEYKVNIAVNINIRNILR